MRRIGRRCRDASPVSTASNGWPARIPASRRMVVPELPASSPRAGGARPPSPRPATLTVDVPSLFAVSSIATPSARRQWSVEPQSAPVE